MNSPILKACLIVGLCTTPVIIISVLGVLPGLLIWAASAACGPWLVRWCKARPTRYSGTGFPGAPVGWVRIWLLYVIFTVTGAWIRVRGDEVGSAGCQVVVVAAIVGLLILLNPEGPKKWRTKAKRLLDRAQSVFARPVMGGLK